MSVYFKILAGALLFPLLLSFDRKVAFYRNWKYLFPSIILSAGLFIPWDILFTRSNIWGFSDDYLSGIMILSLPIEEWLFFVVIPYASVFTFDVIRAYFPGLAGRAFQKYATAFLLLLSLVLLTVFFSRPYTLSTFSLMLVLLLLHHLVFRTGWLNEFYVAWLLVLIPFAVVNGLLTGSWITGEVVWYSPSGIIGIRAGTIPLEDFFYGFCLILLNLGFYNYFRRRSIW